MDIRNAAEDIRNRLLSEEGQKVRIALFGQPGAGKSSLINALVGDRVAEVDARTDTTTDAASYEFPSGILTDLPGYGTTRFPADTFVERFKVLEFDIFLCVTAASTKIDDDSERFFNTLRSLGKTCLIINNKTDSMWQEGRTPEQLRDDKAKDLRKRFGDEQAKVLHTSCRPPPVGIDELSLAIMAAVSPAKAERWARTAKVYSHELLERKRDACDSLCTSYALLSSVNALNPIPGVDMAVDAGILMKAFAAVRDAYGLTDTKLSTVSTLAPALKPLADKIVEQGSKAGLLALLKSMVKKGTARRLAKYIPIAGQIIAAGAGYAFTSQAVQAYTDECHELAGAILDEELKGTKGAK